jgi:hypothetical protein
VGVNLLGAVGRGKIDALVAPLTAQ